MNYGYFKGIVVVLPKAFDPRMIKTPICKVWGTERLDTRNAGGHDGGCDVPHLLFKYLTEIEVNKI